MAALGERDGVLRDRRRLPRQAADLPDLRVGLARLHLARVERDHVPAGGVGDVGAVAVVAERHAVGQDVALPDRVRRLRVGDVDGGDRLLRGPRGPEGPAVGREAALVAVAGDDPGEVEHGVTAVLGDVVERDVARVGRRVAEVGGEDAALLVDQERLVRRHHRQVVQGGRLHGVRGVAHVEDRHPERRAGEVDGVRRKQQRRVVEGADVPGRIGVAQDLEAARRALVRGHGGVAAQARRGTSARDATVDARLRVRAGRAARGRRRGDQRRLGAGEDRRGRRGLAASLAEGAQVVERPDRQLGVRRARQRQHDGEGQERSSEATHGARAYRRSAQKRSDPARRVSDGTRTRDHSDHNRELYQLSYAHRAAPEHSGARVLAAVRGAPEVGSRTL